MASDGNEPTSLRLNGNSAVHSDDNKADVNGEGIIVHDSVQDKVSHSLSDGEAKKDVDARTSTASNCVKAVASGGDNDRTLSQPNEDSIDQNGDKCPTIYEKADKHWQGVSPTVDGMLGGYAHISSTDIAGSTAFLRPFIRGPAAKTKRRRALDCGSGIGRITRMLLLPNFETVDMMDQCKPFLDEAKKFIGAQSERVGHLFHVGMQDFNPEPGVYDVIWIQWALCQLSDDDIVSFLLRLKNGLSENGLIFIKENVNAEGEIDFDEGDNSYTRPRSQLVSLLNKTGLTTVKEEKQANFPKDIYEVRMFALQ